jgi:hypothetical protein
VSTSTLEHPHTHHHRGDHRCEAYRGHGARHRAAIEFFSEGLESDEMLVYVADGDTADDPTIGWLTANIPSERLTLSHITDIYPSNGTFDGPGTVETFRGLAASARADGWSTLRAMADLTKLAADPGTADDLVRYELLIDSTIEEEGLHGFCVYDRYAVSERVPALTATHPPTHRGTTLPTASVRSGVMRLGGELDLMGIESIGDVLANAPVDVSTVALDGLGFLDATGGRALWEFAAERDRRGIPVVFTGASRTVGAVLGVYGLTG